MLPLTDKLVGDPAQIGGGGAFIVISFGGANVILIDEGVDVDPALSIIESVYNPAAKPVKIPFEFEVVEVVVANKKVYGKAPPEPTPLIEPSNDDGQDGFVDVCVKINGSATGVISKSSKAKSFPNALVLMSHKRINIAVAVALNEYCTCFQPSIGRGATELSVVGLKVSAPTKKTPILARVASFVTSGETDFIQ